MNKKLGYKNIVPLIKTVRFVSEKLIIDLVDGRTLSLPLSQFPDMQKLTPAQRRKYRILVGTGLMFDDIDTVYHISDFLGDVKKINYDLPEGEIRKAHSLVAYPKVKYRKMIKTSTIPRKPL